MQEHVLRGYCRIKLFLTDKLLNTLGHESTEAEPGNICVGILGQSANIYCKIHMFKLKLSEISVYVTVFDETDPCH